MAVLYATGARIVAQPSQSFCLDADAHRVLLSLLDVGNTSTLWFALALVKLQRLRSLTLKKLSPGDHLRPSHPSPATGRSDERPWRSALNLIPNQPPTLVPTKMVFLRRYNPLARVILRSLMRPSQMYSTQRTGSE